MVNMRVAVRFDLETGERIGSREITLLEAIQTQGSITGAARSLGISYRGAWLRVRQINQALREPAVSGGPGGRSGGGAAVTPVGMTLIAVYHAVEAKLQAAASEEIHAIRELARSGPTPAGGIS
jgi:molybdate transport system regulatory protein